MRPEPRQCASCGSSKLLMKKKETAATRQIDAEKSLRIKYEVTEISCRDCDFLANDDVNGSTARAYAKLAPKAGAPEPDISATVDDAPEQAECYISNYMAGVVKVVGAR